LMHESSLLAKTKTLQKMMHAVRQAPEIAQASARRP